MIAKSILSAAAVTIGLAAAMPANAALILIGPGEIGGSGLGTVATVLTIQSPANSISESGSVSFNGTTDVITGDALTGASQTRTRTLAEIGSPTTSDFRLVFNAAEPAGNSITLTALTLNVYGTSGNLLYTTSFTDVPKTFAETFVGTGTSGYIFGFDATSIADAAAAFSNPLNRIGLFASATNATGGNETFFIGAAPAVAVPEPMSLALFGAGLLGLGMVRRKQSI